MFTSKFKVMYAYKYIPLTLLRGIFYLVVCTDRNNIQPTVMEIAYHTMSYKVMRCYCMMDCVELSLPHYKVLTDKGFVHDVI